LRHKIKSSSSLARSWGQMSPPANYDV
jgi:hypothetical protein